MELVAPGKTIGKCVINDIVIDEKGVNGLHADLKVDGDNVIMIQGVELEVMDADQSHKAKTLVLSGHILSALSSGWLLIADSGPEKGQHIPIGERTEIGRALDCDISILEPALSRKHAEVEPIGADLILRDLGSANRTLVNGEKVNKVKLKDGDVVKFHKIRFILKAL